MTVIPLLFVVALWTTTNRRIGSTADALETDKLDVTNLAASQLQRLASFRQSELNVSTESPLTSSIGGSNNNNYNNNNIKKQRKRRGNSKQKRPEKADYELVLPVDFNELIRIFDTNKGDRGSMENHGRGKEMQLTPSKIRALNNYADRLMQDEQVQYYIQERIKRDHGYAAPYGPTYGGDGKSNSGAFISGLAGQLVGSFVGLATGASRGSSSSKDHSQPHGYDYHPPPSYGHTKESFSIWDFKKAIINTLLQAVKAISGGVLALKGQLIKGSGFLVASKGKIINSAGDTLSNLGKNLASSAVVYPDALHPGHHYSHGGPYDHNYYGPPVESYPPSSYGAASDVVYAYVYYPQYEQFQGSKNRGLDDNMRHTKRFIRNKKR